MRSEDDRRRRAERAYRSLLLLYPRAFRERFASDLVDLFNDLYAPVASRRSRWARTALWARVLRDTLQHGAAERVLAHRRRPRLPLGAHRSKGPSPMSLVQEDLRHAVRALRASPGFTLVVVLTLALGIGANSAIFTVINAVLLRPLPFADPGRVVMLYEVDPRGSDAFVSLPTLDDWRAGVASIEALSAVGTQTANLTGTAEPDRLRAGFVTAEFFDTLGVTASAGRVFRRDDVAEGAARTAVLTFTTWERRFGSDPAMVGRTLMLNNEPHEVIGILPARFEFPLDAVEVWLPLTSSPSTSAAALQSRRSRNFMAIGRLRADATRERAASELQAVSTRLAAAYPDTNARWTARVEPFHDVSVRLVSRNLKLLAGATAVVLLIACANIANLLLVRASARRREMAVRAALGASRWQLLRQLLAECLLMSLAGGTLGLLLGGVLTDAMLALVPNLPRGDRVAPDSTVVAFTAALSCATALVFGLLPASRTARVDLRDALVETARAGDGRGTGRMRGILVAAELALSLMLLIGAGLLVQSLYRLLTLDAGYRADHVLTLEYRLPRNKYATPAQQWTFHQRALEAIAHVPGVDAASLAQAAPLSGNGSYVGYWKDGEQAQRADEAPRAQFNAVTPAFFRALGVPVVAGRGCAESDTADSPMVVMVNQHLAGRLWPGESPLGHRLRSPDTPGPVTVVGVVGDTRPRLLSMPVTAQIYGCLSQSPGLFATVIARTAFDPMALARSVQQAVWSIDPDQPMWKIRSGEMLVSGSVQTQRFVVLLMALAAGLAVLLAALGTYSVLSYVVQRRTREVGVRMALGATSGHVVRLVLGQTGRVTCAGIGAGLVGAALFSRLLTSQLYEVSPHDPLTFAATAVLLAAVAIFAAWLPAWRATRVDPMRTLRLD